MAKYLILDENLQAQSTQGTLKSLAKMNNGEFPFIGVLDDSGTLLGVYTTIPERAALCEYLTYKDALDSGVIVE